LGEESGSSAYLRTGVYVEEEDFMILDFGGMLQLESFSYFVEELFHAEGFEEDGLEAFLAGADDAVVGS